MLTFAIGDVHGRLDLLQVAFGWIESRHHGRPYKVVMLGDYVDRGPASRGVIEYLMGKVAEGRTICLKGNHEKMMVTALRSGNLHEMSHWVRNGGSATLDSYKGDTVPEEHLAWLEALPVVHQDEHRIYVHAGLMPGLPLNEQDEETMLWIRGPFLNAIPNEMVDRKHVVHGHTPGYAAQRLEWRTNLDSYAYASGQLSVGAFKDDLAGGPVQVYVAMV